MEFRFENTVTKYDYANILASLFITRYFVYTLIVIISCCFEVRFLEEKKKFHLRTNKTVSVKLDLGFVCLSSTSKRSLLTTKYDTSIHRSFNPWDKRIKKKKKKRQRQQHACFHHFLFFSQHAYFFVHLGKLQLCNYMSYRFEDRFFLSKVSSSNDKIYNIISMKRFAPIHRSRPLCRLRCETALCTTSFRLCIIETWNITWMDVSGNVRSEFGR